MPMHIKVPLVTAYFWIIKVLATTVGETFADFFNSNLGLGLTKTSLLFGALTAAVLVAQFRARAYRPVVYWAAVILISITGTLITDNLTDNFGVSLKVTTVLFAVLLAATFGAWFASEGTLSIHSIKTSKREAFYWLAILFTFALGTAGGDLVNEHFGLGYTTGLLLFAGLIALFAGGYRLGLGAVTSFWACYVLTRPLGASLGDLLTQPKVVEEDGAFPGLGIPTGLVNGVFAVVIVALIGFLMRNPVDRLPDDAV